MKYVFDTNAFDRVLDGQLLLASIPSATGFVATKVQYRELDRCPREPRRSDLLRTWHQVGPELLPAAFSFDIPGAGFDEGEWTAGDAVDRLRSDLEALESKFNNWQDALIAGVALKHGFGLVTGDENLRDVAAKHGIPVHYVPKNKPD